MAVESSHRVVIVGGGFGGLYAAQALARAPVRVTLVDRRNFHLFQPLLYQLATGGLGTGDISSPIRHALKKQRNVAVVLGEVTDVDAAGHRLVLGDGTTLEYDSLVLAAGVGNHYYGHGDWERLAPGLKSLEDAVTIRNRVLRAFEAAEREADPAQRAAWLSFVVVGAGPTGVELAGALGELAHHTLRGEFRRADPRTSRIILVDDAHTVLPAFDPSLSRRALRSLARLGIETRLGARVRGIDADGVTIGHPGQEERIAARTVLWAAGVRGSPLGEAVTRATGATLDEMGRVRVNPDLTVGAHREIYVIGDLARVEYRGRPIACVAPAAMQQGRYVARAIRRRAEGKPSQGPFRYLDKGSLATIGRSAAVADFRGFRFWGFPAWLLWLVVHLIYLIEFENRLLVLIQWANNYITRHRGSRIILELPGKTPEGKEGETPAEPPATSRFRTPRRMRVR